MRLAEYTAGVEHLVALGNFENIKIIRTVTVIPDDDDLPADVAAYAADILETALRPDLERALEASAEPNTYLETWLYGLPEPAPAPPPRKPSRK